MFQAPESHNIWVIKPMMGNLSGDYFTTDANANLQKVKS